MGRLLCTRVPGLALGHAVPGKSRMGNLHVCQRTPKEGKEDDRGRAQRKDADTRQSRRRGPPRDLSAGGVQNRAMDCNGRGAATGHGARHENLERTSKEEEEEEEEEEEARRRHIALAPRARPGQSDRQPSGDPKRAPLRGGSRGPMARPAAWKKRCLAPVTGFAPSGGLSPGPPTARRGKTMEIRARRR
ncbi:unnamed protein product [Prorocentrum cordatum]|uniref:Uncharacterized protein n=1 Tax=Prorocentrum cordatum TaxID=2364126 RepID=A0ABN9W0G9_9DINO|nr:unnamed protein product [Polarella glacialis]